jgi:hypothetical protein
LKNETYIELILREARRLKHLADQAIAQVPDESFFSVFGDEDNSIAILIKHLTGNMHSRWRDFLTSDGEKPNRYRDTEFILTADDTREHLLNRWETGWQIFFDAVTPLSLTDLERTVTIRGEPFTVLQAINRQLTHYSYHVGQLVFLAKCHAESGWKSLSVPKGQSEKFNKKPTTYLNADDV